MSGTAGPRNLRHEPLLQPHQGREAGQPQKCTPAPHKHQGWSQGSLGHGCLPCQKYHSRGVIGLSYRPLLEHKYQGGDADHTACKPLLQQRFRAFLSDSNSWSMTQTHRIFDASRNQNQENSVQLVQFRCGWRQQNYQLVRLVSVVTRLSKGGHTFVVAKS